jgi:hypothetical protein
MDINPFESVIVSEPRRIEKPVSGLNDLPLERLLSKVEQLTGAEFPKAVKLPGAQFIQSPAPGYGKSHLIGRLFKHLHGRATLIYLRPFANPSTCWKSILLKMVQELEFPESAAAEFCGVDEPNQLEALVHGILVNVVINGLKSDIIRHQHPVRAVDYFQRATLKQLRANKQWIAWVGAKKTGLAELMERQLKEKGMLLSASPLSWFSVLVQYAYFPKSYELRQSSLDWLRGGSIDDANAGKIGILAGDRPVHDLAIDPVNETSKHRIVDFCSLAGFYRPFLFCFDQTENYGADPVTAKCLGMVIQGLVDDCPNHLTVVTANQHPWHQVVQPHWEHAHVDRLARPVLELSGLRKDQARELIAIRLRGWDQGSAKAKRLRDAEWLDEVFRQSREIGIRQFLLKCSEQWLTGDTAPQAEPKPPASEKELENAFQAYVNKIKTQPKRLVYDPDALFWLVQEVACRQGVAFKKFKSTRGYLVARWDVDGRKIYFGFEAGHHFKRWQAIQQEAGRYHAADPSSKVVFFRTPELRFIPGPGWQSAPQIAAAKRGYLHILVLDRETMAQLYAAYDLYLDAVEGNLPFKADQALAFIRSRLKPVWDRMLEPAPEKWGGGPPQAKQRPPEEGGGPEKTLIRKIRDIVKRDKFLSLADLMAKISPPVSEEELHRARSCIAEIQVHTSPNMTVLQWRPNK